jgi:hypothetical protein
MFHEAVIWREGSAALGAPCHVESNNTATWKRNAYQWLAIIIGNGNLVLERYGDFKLQLLALLMIVRLDQSLSEALMLNR